METDGTTDAHQAGRERLEIIRGETAAQVEMIKGLTTLPVEGLKMLCLINGGAVISILTYLGNYGSRANLSAASANCPTMLSSFVAKIVPAMIGYSVGLSASALDLILAYAIQVEFSRNIKLYMHNRGSERDKLDNLIIAGGALALLSVVSFVCSSGWAAYAFSTLSTSCPTNISPKLAH